MSNSKTKEFDEKLKQLTDGIKKELEFYEKLERLRQAWKAGRE